MGFSRRPDSDFELVHVPGSVRIIYVTDIQYRNVLCIIHISPSLITVARVHSTLHPCSSNQCDTARLE
jgi:hypothetical protein